MRRSIYVLLLLCAIPVFAQSNLFISEYIEGTSNNKALEIFNASPSAVNLSNYQIRMYSNGSVNPSVTITLTSAQSLAPGDVHVVVHAQASGSLLALGDQFNNQGWYNGNDAIALVFIPTNTVLDVIGQIGFDPGSEWGSGLTSTADNTLRRKPTVTQGDPIGNNAFVPSVEWDGFPTNDQANLGQHNGIIVTPVTVREIFEIQGSGAASPFAGQIVETRDNIVTAVGTQGFFIQTPDFRADASTLTSNGIYVFTNSAPAGIAVGQQVDVKGTVTEFFNFTEYAAGATVTIDAQNQPLPAYVTLAQGFSDFERYEGMLVRAQNATAVDGTDHFNETMAVVGPRPFRTPGIAGNAHPEIFDVDPTGLGGAAQQIIGGANISLAQGPLAFDFGDYAIWTTTLNYTNPTYPRPARARNAGELTVGAQNMFRLFDDVNDPSAGEPVTAPATYAARLATFSAHIRNNMKSPDILAVSEVENLSTLQDLADRLNFDDATLGYTAYLLEGNDVGYIDVGFLVRDSISVASVTQLGANDTWIDPQNNQPDLLNDRPPLLLQGSYDANGAPFPIAVIAVHQRSLIDVETSARVRAKRLAQANNLVSHLQTLQSANANLRLVVTGDFNAFEFDDGYVDVMGVLMTGADLTNQVLTVPANDRYSYIEDGVAQVLDHSLTSQALNPFVRDFDFAHANADAPVAFNTPSDHEGVVLFVMTDYDADGYADDTDACPQGDARPTVILGSCDSGVANIIYGGGCSLTDTILALKASAKNHGQFVSEVGKLLNGLMKNGTISGAQKGAIESCVARMN